MADLWVAASFTSTNQLVYATDPTGTWTATTVSAMNSIGALGVAKGDDGNWVMVGGNGTSGRLAYTKDPLGTWTAGSVVAGLQYIFGVQWVQGTWAFVPYASGTAYYSENPGTAVWSTGVAAVAGAMGVNNTNGYFFAGPYTTGLRYATTTTVSGTWSTATASPGTNTGFKSATYGGDGYYVATADVNGTNYLYYGTAVSSWTMVSGGFSNSTRGVAWGDGYWVVGAANGQMRYINGTPNGTWSAITSPFTTGDWVSTIVYRNGIWVAGTESGKIAYCKGAPSGTWSAASSVPASLDIRRIIVAGGLQPRVSRVNQAVNRAAIF